MEIFINTNQNVRIQFEICSISNRIIAFLVDSIIVGGIALVFFFLGIIISFGSSNIIFSFFGLIPVFFYHLICELTMNGQSVGKRMRNIKVMKSDGSQASFSSYFLRFLLRPIDSIYGLGLAFIFFTEKGQRLGDLAGGTIIVDVKSDISIKELDKNINNVKYEIVYPQVQKLSDNDIDIIRKILGKRSLTPEHKNVKLLTVKIKSVLNISSNETDYQFLKTIVDDYHSMYS